MPKIKVEIEYDWPEDPYWLNPDNVKLSLDSYCNPAYNNHRQINFKVKWAKDGDPWSLPDLKNFDKKRLVRI